ncbi:hypothetical protein [Streptomyces sp. 6N106]|uniref:hypothetical protein n=1 Tax=Streptomyces sp. 6N106 TaxID=3457418 RepID=UPI003FD150C2
MADDSRESFESAETQKPAPVEEPAAVPDKTPPLRRRLRSCMEMTYWVLAIDHYGMPHAHEAWGWVQEQLLPLVRPYL